MGVKQQHGGLNQNYIDCRWGLCLYPPSCRFTDRGDDHNNFNFSNKLPKSTKLFYRQCRTNTHQQRTTTTTQHKINNSRKDRKQERHNIRRNVHKPINTRTTRTRKNQSTIFNFKQQCQRSNQKMPSNTTSPRTRPTMYKPRRQRSIRQQQSCNLLRYTRNQFPIKPCVNRKTSHTIQQELSSNPRTRKTSKNRVHHPTTKFPKCLQRGQLRNSQFPKAINQFSKISRFPTSPRITRLQFNTIIRHHTNSTERPFMLLFPSQHHTTQKQTCSPQAPTRCSPPRPLRPTTKQSRPRPQKKTMRPHHKRQKNRGF